MLGKAEDGSLIFDDDDYEKVFIPGNQWWITSHDATEFGTKLLQNIIGKKFTFPKSLYAVHDVISFFLNKKKNAVVLDFFAGSGTTLHAVNLLNLEDDGQRKCILVTNNEVSESEATELKNRGYKPGDEKWNKMGIARYVTWPRTKNTILGKKEDGSILRGEYITSITTQNETERNYFQVSFLDDANISKRKEFVGLLRDQSGKSQLPKSLVTSELDYIVSEKHTASILFSTEAENEWIDKIGPL